jgi:hypothetical protein
MIVLQYSQQKGGGREAAAQALVVERKSSDIGRGEVDDDYGSYPRANRISRIAPQAQKWLAVLL